MIWLNGEWTKTASLPTDDRGYLLGDGLFETLLAQDGKAVFVELHLDRLYQSLPIMAMPSRYQRSQIAPALAAIAEDTFKTSGATRSVVRLTVTRMGGRGLDMNDTPEQQNWLITATPAAAPPTELAVTVLELCRPSSAPTSRLKSVNYLDNILARRQAVQDGADEAILLNEHGRLACAAAANIFIIKNGVILTPSVSEGALPGTRRNRLLAKADIIEAKSGLKMSETPISQEDLETCDAAFLTNSLIGAVPVTRIGDRPKEKSPAMQAISECLVAE